MLGSKSQGFRRERVPARDRYRYVWTVAFVWTRSGSIRSPNRRIRRMNVTAREFHARACTCNSRAYSLWIAANLDRPDRLDMHPAGTDSVGLGTMMGEQQSEQREAPHRAHHPPPLTHYRHPNATAARSKPTHFLSLRCRGAVEGAVTRVQQVNRWGSA